MGSIDSKDIEYPYLVNVQDWKVFVSLRVLSSTGRQLDGGSRILLCGEKSQTIRSILDIRSVPSVGD